jgi:hypothetical protein
MTLHPLNGWLLSAVAQLDLHSPGTAGHVLRSSDERRHVVASLLSVTESSDFSTELGELIQAATHDKLIEAAFGKKPCGYRAALGRAGKHTQPRRFYLYLAQLLADPTRAEMAAVVRRLDRVTWPRLKILRALPTDLRHPTLVNILSDPRQARDLSRSVALLGNHGGDRQEMCLALRQAKTTEMVSQDVV